MARTAKIAKSLKKPKFKVRIRNRCRCCGRARGYIRKFQMLQKICFRGMALKGEIPRRRESQLVGELCRRIPLPIF